MKKNLYKILIISGLIIIIGIIVYFNNVIRPGHVREHYNDDARELRSERKERSIKKKSLTENFYQKVQKKEIFDEKVDDLNRSLNTLEGKVKGREVYCLKVLNETIDNDEYIDISDPMYDDIETIKQLYSNILNEAMVRPEADQLYETVYKAVESEAKIDPRLLFSRIERIDICRDPKALNFIDTVSEAYRLKKWPQSVGEELVSQMLDVGKEALSKNKSVENLLYFTNVLLIMADNGLVPTQFSADLEDLSRRMNENHSIFKDIFGERQSRETNSISFSDYLRRNEELGVELRQVFSDIENSLSINY